MCRFAKVMSFRCRRERMDMLYKYEDIVRLRDEIGSCPNIESEIDVTGYIYFIRPYHVKDEDKVVLDKEIKRLCHLGILKSSAYSSPVMFISKEMIKSHFQISNF